MKLTVLFVVLFSFHLAAGDDVQVQFAFPGFAGANLTVDGNATVTPDGLVVLNSRKTNLKGHAFYPTPLRFRGSPGGQVHSFASSFVFAIVSDYTDFSAHGMALVVCPTPESLSSALPAGYLALLNVQNNGNASNHLFAVELDTTQNTDFKDINSNHVGIDVNDLHSLQSHPTGYYLDGSGDFRNLTLFSREAMQVWVSYDGGTGQIDVTLAPLGVAKPARPLVSDTYNLSSVITEQAYIGFSSSTGGINTRHYVLGWSFAMNGPAPAIDIAKLPKLPRFGPKPRSKVLEIVLPIATAAVVLAVCTVVALLLLRHLRYAQLLEDWEIEFGPHRFSYKELYHATKGFKSKHLLGAGGFGKVYKGVLSRSKLEVAIKKISHESRQGTREFIAEVVSIGRLRNPNLVQLLGYCRRKGELLLVYEYMPNGSLDKYLYGECEGVLDWAKRFHAIKGVASGLLYIHERWEKVVIHRDIKASNVLLDGEMNGRLGDFGLARLYDHGTDPHTTHVVGTMGYLAPELVRTGKASTLTDVFAFGAFLLEITCGRRPVSNGSPGMDTDSHEMLVDWVLDHFRRGCLAETVDARLGGDCDVDEACRVLKLGLLCSHPFASTRPSMRQVMHYLDSDTPLPDLSLADMTSFSTMALLQNQGFDSYAISYPSSMGSIGTVSYISGGR
ncbi:L-type lectin-domain containing receptor kinase SIT2-like [Hordeum vulgare subsp. vulgare]|uniref:non-specific serine/threonine protein kinase n=1 Tax=Hordeum vulgare subsp. vulgare TaxID=112509 RepID=A0A8I6YM89_HORVV|nr:L-type lectin-domain containing receptor kinase SIT2-like [Hordeum vulgare subsp. vulgare]